MTTGLDGGVDQIDARVVGRCVVGDRAGEFDIAGGFDLDPVVDLARTHQQCRGVIRVATNLDAARAFEGGVDVQVAAAGFERGAVLRKQAIHPVVGGQVDRQLDVNIAAFDAGAFGQSQGGFGEIPAVGFA